MSRQLLPRSCRRIGWHRQVVGHPPKNWGLTKIFPLCYNREKGDFPHKKAMKRRVGFGIGRREPRLVGRGAQDRAEDGLGALRTRESECAAGSPVKAIGCRYVISCPQPTRPLLPQGGGEFEVVPRVFLALENLRILEGGDFYFVRGGKSGPGLCKHTGNPKCERSLP